MQLQLLNPWDVLDLGILSRLHLNLPDEPRDGGAFALKKPHRYVCTCITSQTSTRLVKQVTLCILMPACSQYRVVT